MKYRYSINLPVSLSRTALSILSKNFLCANRSGVSFCCVALRYVSITSWVLYFFCACLLLVLWANASSSFSFFVVWDTSCGDRLGITICSTLGVGTTIGGVAVDDISGVGSDAPLGCLKSRWGVDNIRVIGTPDPTFCASTTCTFLVCLGSVIGGVCCSLSFFAHPCLRMVPSCSN